jgi:superfamily II DNA/RNA helicase
MLDLGFTPQLEAIQRTMRGTWQTLLFSASFGRGVEEIAKIFMRDNIVMVRSENAEAPVTSLRQKLVLLPGSKKNSRLLEELKAMTGSVLLFANSQGNCEKVSGYLNEYGHSSEYIHGGLSQAHRTRIMTKFREGALRVLVTTDLLARGLDVPIIENIVNFELPIEPEDFLHRIGRTARAGRPGVAVTFVTPADSKTYKLIKPYLAGAEEEAVDMSFRLADSMGEAPKPPKRKKYGKSKKKLLV